MRIAIATNIPTPYRAPLFSKIASSPGVCLRVFFCEKKESGRSWDWQPNQDFDYEFCASLRIGKQRGVTYISPGLVRHIASFEPDAVVAGGLMIGLTARMAARANGSRFYVWSEATYDSDYSSRSRLSLCTLRRLVASADGCIASSSDAADYFAFLGAPIAKITTAIMGVDVTLFLRDSRHRLLARSRARDQIGLKGPTILYAGKLEEHKGVDLLLAAHRVARDRLPSCELLLVGDGSMRPVIEHEVSAGRLEGVHLTGFRQPADLPQYFFAADAFCLMSRREPFGAVVPEAMAAGLPTVCSYHVGSARDFIEEGVNGFVVDPEDPILCASRLVAILSDPEKAEAMSGAAQKSALGAAPDISAQALLSALGAGPPSNPPADRQP